MSCACTQSGASTCAGTCTQTISQVNPGTLPLWNEPQLPQDGTLILLLDQLDNCGGNDSFAYRLPLTFLTGGGVVSTNQYSLFSPTNTINPLNNQVIPIFQESASPYMLDLAKADSNATLARFMAISTDPLHPSDRVIVQSTSFYTFPVPHLYAIGATYYTSDTTAGEVVSVAPAIAQPVFYVLDALTILILLGS